MTPPDSASGEGRSKPRPHPVLSKQAWTIIGVVSTIVIGIITIVVALFPYIGVHPPAAQRSAESTPAASAAGPPAAAGEGSGCRSAGGASVGCAAPGSGLIVDVTTCTPSGVRDAWGYPAGVPLAITTSPLSEGCLVSPSEIATAAGTSGADLAQASQGQIESRMLTCARKDGSTMVSCAGPHEYEWVSDWTSLPAGQVAETWCRDLVTAYTANSLGSGSRMRSNMFSSNSGDVRCAVSVELSTLTDTLWRIGGKELPLG